MKITYGFIFDKTNKKTQKTDNSHPMVRCLKSIIFEGKPKGRVIALRCKIKKKSFLLGAIFHSQQKKSGILFFPGTQPRYIVFYNQRKEQQTHPVDHITYDSSNNECHFTFSDIDKQKEAYDRIPSFPAMNLGGPEYAHRWFGLSLENVKHLVPAKNVEIEVDTPDSDAHRRIEEMQKIDISGGIDIPLDEFYRRNREYIGLKGFPLHAEFLITDKNQNPNLKPIVRANREGKIGTVSGFTWLDEAKKGIYIFLMPACIKTEKNGPAAISFQRRC